MFVDSVDEDVAALIVERLTASDAPMRAAQLRVLGGAVARVPADATAYAHRSSRIMVNVAAFYDGADDLPRRRSWVEDLVADLQQDDAGAYVNFVADEGPERVRAAYPGATWDRLAAVKATYDPANLFRLQPEHPARRRELARCASVLEIVRDVRLDDTPATGVSFADVANDLSTYAGEPPVLGADPHVRRADPWHSRAMGWWGGPRWVGPLVCAGLVLAGCNTAVDRAGGGGDPEPTVLRMVDPLFGVETQPFVDAVSRLSHGSLRIDHQINWHKGDLGAESDLIGYVRRGGAPLGVTPVRAWHTAGISSFDALIAPFVLDSMAAQKAVLESDVVDDMLRGMGDPGLTGLGVLPGPLRRPIGVTHELVTAGDYRGGAIGVSLEGEVANRTFAGIGREGRCPDGPRGADRRHGRPRAAAGQRRGQPVRRAGHQRHGQRHALAAATGRVRRREGDVRVDRRPGASPAGGCPGVGRTERPPERRRRDRGSRPALPARSAAARDRDAG